MVTITCEQNLFAAEHIWMLLHMTRPLLVAIRLAVICRSHEGLSANEKDGKMIIIT